MRIAVCEGNEQELAYLSALVTEYRVSRGTDVDCRFFHSGADFLYGLKGGEYDVVLLDAFLPGLSGIQTAYELRELDKDVKLIFISSSSEFAVESYSVGAYHYILKPVSADSLFLLLDRVQNELPVQDEQGFVLKKREGVIRILFAQLEYVEVINKTVSFHLADGAIREATAALADYEEKILSGPEFIKTHRAYIVNLRYVLSIGGNCIVTKNEHRIPVSRKRRSQVQDAYMFFLSRVGMIVTASGTQPGTVEAHGTQPGTVEAHGAQPGTVEAHGVQPGIAEAHGAQSGTVEAHGAQPGIVQVRSAQPKAVQVPDVKPGMPTERVERYDALWRILLVDDEPGERTFWADILRYHGCVVDLAENGEDALQMALDCPYDCVLLDVMIPGEDGFSICERLRNLINAPVIFLSSLTESDRQLEGFAAGGIDYITKDTPAELFWAKVEIRIKLAMSERTQFCYGPLLLDLTERKALMNGKELLLDSAEFDLLWRLSEHAGHIFAPEEIFGIVWGNQPWDSGYMVQTHMSRLRRKLEKAYGEHHFIEAVWGQGYRFVPTKSET